MNDIRTFKTVGEARAHLGSLGLSIADTNHEPHRREYWTRGKGQDVFLDHSATITKVGKVYATSVFTK